MDVVYTLLTALLEYLCSNLNVYTEYHLLLFSILHCAITVLNDTHVVLYQVCQPVSCSFFIVGRMYATSSYNYLSSAVNKAAARIFSIICDQLCKESYSLFFISNFTTHSVFSLLMCNCSQK